MHNGTLHEVGASIEHNSDGCEQVIWDLDCTKVVHHVCQVNLTCEMCEESGVASVVYQVDTADCGSAVLDHIREKVDSNSHKLDQLLACNSCNGSNSTTFTTGPLGNNKMQYTLCRLRYI